jgi:DNA mismatch endonuclease (patch repair protein)
MSRIRGKDTGPEMVVRSILHRMGYRFRLHVKGLPGRPDVVLPKYRTVVFVHGCFWHRHRGCKNCTTPTHRREWWLRKLEGNAARDRLHLRELGRMGWKAVVVWECEVEKKLERLEQRLAGVAVRQPGRANAKEPCYGLHGNDVLFRQFVPGVAQEVVDIEYWYFHARLRRA